MDTLLNIAITSAREAGAEILKHYKTQDFVTKSDGSPVTIADTRSNEILLKHLERTVIPILSEESESPHTSNPYPPQLWIIDPLDGTKDFLRKNGYFSVMLGLLEHGRPTLGVVYAPALEKLYYATKGGGAFVESNGVVKKLTVGTRVSEHLRFVRSVNHFTEDMEAVGKKLNVLFTPRGSIGIKTGFIGEDEGDFFFSQGKLGEWDVCGPEIIMTEAGGMVTDCTGNPLFYGTEDHRLTHGLIFSNGACHERVLEAIKTL